MSVTRTFTVTVAGSKFVIDGVSQATVTLAEGYTYKFDQSDNTNATHPLAFATATDAAGGTQYTTGVTTNGTPGNSGAYTQITVADSAPTLYYYCTNHSGMGGQANTVDADTWGLLEWGQNSWGQQDVSNVYPTGLSITSTLGEADVYPEQGWGRFAWGQKDWGDNSLTITLTGVSMTGSLGTPTANAEQGWGRAAWGEEPWGESYSPVISPTGYSLTTSLGTLPYAQSEEGWGRDAWGENNWGQNTTTVVLTGLDEITTGLGPDGWGAISFGNGEWGGEFTFKPESIIVPTGVSTTSSIGSTTQAFDMIFGITAPSAIGAGLGTLSLNDGSDHVQGLGSLVTTSSVGSLSHTMAYDLTGIFFDSTLGVLDISNVELVNLTGVTTTASVGSISPTEMGVGLTGVSATASVGSISPTEMGVGLTGVSATASVADMTTSSGGGIIAYADIDTGSNTSYTDVAA